jgi:hypothetical protein
MKEETKCYCGHTTYCDCGPEEPKKETLEEAAERKFQNIGDRLIFKDGTKWQQERSYSEEDMKDAYIQGTLGLEYKKNFNESFYKWFEQFKKK